MRVLFLEKSPVWIYGLPNGFSDAGHHVMISGPLTETNMPSMITEFGPDLIIVIGWGPEQTKQKQLWIRKYVHKAAIPLVYWAVEDPAFLEAWSLPLIQTIKPDVVFSICPSSVLVYQSLGIHAFHMDFGYHSNVHFPTTIDNNYHSQISVVANAYPQVLEKYPDHYRHTSLQTLILPLLHNDLRVDFYGRDWDKMRPFLGFDIPEQWIHGYLPYTEANKVYSSSAIIIGLQNYLTQVTQRTYEVLGSGGFLLTSDTPGVRDLFTPGIDLSTSSSAEETLRLVRYYLKHPDAREQIRKQGKRAVEAYTYRHRAEQMIQTMITHGVLREDAASVNGPGNVEHYWVCDKEKYELYLVCPTDTLWKISKKFGVSIDQIRQLNGMVNDTIYTDHYLKIRRKTDTHLLSVEKQDISPQISPEIAKMFRKASSLLNLDIKLLYGIAFAETNMGKNMAVSSSGAYGIMQLKPETAEEMGVDHDKLWPNILGGSMYIKQQLIEFGGDIPKALAAYNWGAANVKRIVKDYDSIWLVHAPEETRKYVMKIVTFMDIVQ